MVSVLMIIGPANSGTFQTAERILTGVEGPVVYVTHSHPKDEDSEPCMAHDMAQRQPAWAVVELAGDLERDRRLLKHVSASSVLFDGMEAYVWRCLEIQSLPGGPREILEGIVTLVSDLARRNTRLLVVSLPPSELPLEAQSPTAFVLVDVGSKANRCVEIYCGNSVGRA